MATSIDVRPVFNNKTLTASYVVQSTATTVDYIETSNVSNIVLNILYTTGSDGAGSSLQVKMETADPTNGLPVSADWMQTAIETVAATILTEAGGIISETGASSATAYPISVSIPIGSKYVRFSVKETKAGAVFGTVTMKAALTSSQTYNS